MEAVQIVLLSFVQGLTEFLPISSSGHLVLAPLLFGYALQSLAFDVAVHLGTLIAVMLYFRREIAAMTRNRVLGNLSPRICAVPRCWEIETPQSPRATAPSQMAY